MATIAEHYRSIQIVRMKPSPLRGSKRSVRVYKAVVITWCMEMAQCILRAMSLSPRKIESDSIFLAQPNTYRDSTMGDLNNHVISVFVKNFD